LLSLSVIDRIVSGAMGAMGAPGPSESCTLLERTFVAGLPRRLPASALRFASDRGGPGGASP